MRDLFEPHHFAERGGHYGFTLIELLVVISIIMILSGMLFPTFAKARGTARQISCVSNLRQCGIALQMYRDDWDDRLPAQDLSQLTGFTTATTSRDIQGPEEAIWIGQLYRYLKNGEVMRCKVADDSTVDRFNGVTIGLGLNIYVTRYSLPGGGVGANVVWYGAKLRSDSESDTMVMADCNSLVFTQSADGMMNVAYADSLPGAHKIGDRPEDSSVRHVSGSNVLFGDGHVKSYTPQRLLAEIPPVE